MRHNRFQKIKKEGYESEAWMYLLDQEKQKRCHRHPSHQTVAVTRRNARSFGLLFSNTNLNTKGTSTPAVQHRSTQRGEGALTYKISAGVGAKLTEIEKNS